MTIKIIESNRFKQVSRKLNIELKNRIEKQIKKIIANPEVGKPMRYNRKGTREVYVGHFRLSYSYLFNEEKIILLDFYHKDGQ